MLTRTHLWDLPVETMSKPYLRETKNRKYLSSGDYHPAQEGYPEGPGEVDG